MTGAPERARTLGLRHAGLPVRDLRVLRVLALLGVAEYVLRRVRRYGNLLVDAETRRLVDVLPERSADSFAAWLADRPGVEPICRGLAV